MTAPKDRQPPTAANRQPMQTATDRQPPTFEVEIHDHEAESVPVNVRSCSDSPAPNPPGGQPTHLSTSGGFPPQTANTYVHPAVPTGMLMR